MKNNFSIAVIIPTHNRIEPLLLCIECLQKQKLSHNSLSLFLKIVVIIDGSTDGTVEKLKEINSDESITILYGDGNFWYTKCINEGLVYAQRNNFDFVLTLNDDITFDDNYVLCLINDFLSIKNSKAIVGSIAISDHKYITFSGVKKVTFTLKELHYLPHKSEISNIEMTGVKKSIVLSGRGILIPLGVINELGIYDSKLIQYGSETDYTFRAHKKYNSNYISYNARIFERIELTSSGAVFNNPDVYSFVKSLFNKYSINSAKKTFYYTTKHRGILLGTPITIIRVIGSVKNFLLKKLLA